MDKKFVCQIGNNKKINGSLSEIW